MKIAINGANGRMGRLIASIVKDDENMRLVGVMENPESDLIGKSFDDKLKFVGSLKDIGDKPDVVIDFTIPCATLFLLKDAVDEGIAIVTGTTGFSQEEIEILNKASERIPVLFSPNMSLGVNLLFKLVGEAAKVLKDKDYDVEIFEIHHRFKKDAPSGTAVRLAEIVADSMEKSLDKTAVFGREGFVGERKKNEIGIFAARMGDVVGEHTVYFATLGERLELTHHATSRETFARGAIVAAKWICGKPSGFYSMFDVLGI